MEDVLFTGIFRQRANIQSPILLKVAKHFESNYFKLKYEFRKYCKRKSILCDLGGSGLVVRDFKIRHIFAFIVSVFLFVCYFYYLYIFMVNFIKT